MSEFAKERFDLLVLEHWLGVVNLARRWNFLSQRLELIDLNVHGQVVE